MNNAELDPYRDGEIPNQLPLSLPRQPHEELQGEFIDPEWSDELDEYVGHLDGQEYRPSPTIIPDVRVGFDEDGNFHTVQHFTQDRVGSAITPFRWARYLNDALMQYCSTFDYTVGRSEQDDIVQDIVSDRMERAATMEERYQLEEALEVWRVYYGNR